MATSISARLRTGVVTATAEETRALAAELAVVLPDNTTLALHGDMGVGKTTFVQGLARGLGVKEQVTSPTFAIYAVHLGATRRLIHLDAYRIGSSRELEELLLEDFLVTPWCLAVEWPEKTGLWLPATAWHLELAIVDGERHRIRLQ